MNRPLITKNSVCLKVAAQNWEEAVREVGRIMFRQGLVEEKYIGAMIDAVKKFGPYIVLAPGIAFPHARPEDGALATGIGMVTLLEPVPFGNTVNDPVDIVIGLASKDNTSHISLLSQLCEFLEKAANLERLRSATDVGAVVSLINQSGKEGLE